MRRKCSASDIAMSRRGSLLPPTGHSVVTRPGIYGGSQRFHRRVHALRRASGAAHGGRLGTRYRVSPSSSRTAGVPFDRAQRVTADTFCAPCENAQMASASPTRPGGIGDVHARRACGSVAPSVFAPVHRSVDPSTCEVAGLANGPEAVGRRARSQAAYRGQKARLRAAPERDATGIAQCCGADSAHGQLAVRTSRLVDSLRGLVVSSCA